MSLVSYRVKSSFQVCWVLFLLFAFLLLSACSAESNAYDFMFFANSYPGNYGIGGVIKDAVNGLLLKEQDTGKSYQGILIRNQSTDIERSLLYDMLIHKKARIIFFLPRDIYSFLSLITRYPEQKFVLPYSLDSHLDNLSPNLKMVRLGLEQGAFLAGIIAGTMTRQNRVGMLSDMMERYTDVAAYAFVQGIRQVNPSSQIVIVQTTSGENILENETTRIVSIDQVDVLFALSMNYNSTIIRSAYYFSSDVLLINSWYNADLEWPRHVITSLEIFFEPIMEYFLKHSESMEEFSSLPLVKIYDLSDKDVMRFSWDDVQDADTVFEQERRQYRDLSRKARATTQKYAQRIHNKQFKVFNLLENSVPPLELQDFHFRSSYYHQEEMAR